MAPRKNTLLLLAVLVVLTCLKSGAHATYTGQFKEWYPQLRPSLSNVLAHNCSAEYEVYLSGNTTGHETDYVGGASELSTIVQPVVNCILKNVSNYVQSFMSSAQVLLGLTPTILAFLGTSTEEAAMVAVVGRRPLLSMLLALGSPSVYFGRALEEYKPLAMLKNPPKRFNAAHVEGHAKFVVNVLEYLVVTAAVVNVGLLDWQLGVRTICTFMSYSPLGPVLWSLLVIPVHLLGCLVVRLRIRRITEGEDETRKITFWSWIGDVPARASYVLSNVFTPSSAQPGVRVAVYPEVYWKLATRWLLTMFTIGHLIFGTLMLSSLLFLGPEDALSVVARYCVSVLASRLVVMYELAGISLQFHSPAGGVVNSHESAEESQVYLNIQQGMDFPLRDFTKVTVSESAFDGNSTPLPRSLPHHQQQVQQTSPYI